MITIKTEEEIKKMQKAGRILAEILIKLQKAVRPGFSTGRLEMLARNLIHAANARPAFLGYSNGKHEKPFPSALCISINHELVHAPAFPSRIFQLGDLVSIDCGIEYQKFFSDAAITFTIGKPSALQKKIIRVTKKALELGIKKVRNGAYVGDISSTIQKYVEKNNFSVIRDLVGHGIGRALHEEPPIPNFGKEGEGIKLKTGMTLAIEPMVSAGSPQVETLNDGWTVIVKDKSLSAHFEHTVVVGQRGAQILTKI